jgi:hypothetical protein
MASFNFPPTSRYHGIETATLNGPKGKIAYLRRRLLPSRDRFSLLREHTVTEGERLDHIAGRELGDPEAFWRIADANNAMRPGDLTDPPGRRLAITLPEGIPGTPNA